MGSDPAIRKWYCDFDIYRPCSYIRSSVDTLEYIYILYLSKSIHTCVFEQVAHLKAILVTNGLTLLVLTTVPHTAIHFPVINKYYILTTITNYSIRSIYYVQLRSLSFKIQQANLRQVHTNFCATIYNKHLSIKYYTLIEQSFSLNLKLILRYCTYSICATLQYYSKGFIVVSENNFNCTAPSNSTAP